ncbi:MAG: phosphoribosylamine--glycine ligase, partial [Deltaproteobacteria bacterium]|nr:phosphoribosylamine--glycine ligase [Deltaproteobacteria bacterium]
IVAFAQRVFKDAEFGKPPHTILIEDFVDGTEISYIGLCDGECFVALESATDYKRIFDDGEGPNTGGMGAVSPSPFLTSDLKAVIEETIVAPIVRGLKTRKLAYNGALFIGLMISRGRPLVLEFNVRFGDPETQAILMRLESDLVDLLWATADGKLSALPPPLWSKDMSVYVVATAEGYPGKPTGGDTIQGLESTLHSSQLFSAGIDKLGDSWVTGGGRILGVGAKAATVASAREIAYKSLSNIGWRGMHFRTDIGKGI